MTGVGHNGGPPIDAPKFSKKRWALAIFSHPKKPHGAVAMAFKIFVEMDADGNGAVISDEEFRLCCGVSDGSCRVFKRWLLKEGFIQIALRGRRGRGSEFTATIPAATAAISEAEAAPIAGNEESEYRQPMPVDNHGLPATNAGNAGIPAVPAAVPARSLVINYNNKNNYLPTTTVEQEAASGGDYFEALNGSAIDLTQFISKAANVDLDVAKNMLRTNIKTYGASAMLEAYSTTLAEMAESVVATPYKYLLGCAKKNKERSARTTVKADGKHESVAERRARRLREMDEAENGGRSRG